MAKVVDITEKLGFEGNPVLKVRDTELEVNADAATVLQIMGIFSEEEVTPKNIVDACDLLFTEDSNKKIMEMKLNFEDYQTLVMAAVDLAVGNDEDAAGK